jgi:signal transduction histidine kinase
MDNKKSFEQPGMYSDTVASLSKKLIEVNKKLQKTEYERTEMIENISHDLRAPLTAIRSTIDYCMEKCSGDKVLLSPDEMNSMLRLLDTRVKTLEVLIQDLYLMTCIDSGREVFKYEQIPIFQFLEEYFFAVEIDKKYEGYNLEMEIPERADAFVNIDVAKISRVLDNLFTNARKYSEVGSTITLGAGEDDDKVFFYVKDTGLGIPEDAVSSVFDRTYRVSDARTPAKESGSGLGLSIARSIVMQHGGTIKCESKEGEGSRFTVELPLARPEEK